MRCIVLQVALMGLAAAATGCAPVENGAVQVVRVNEETIGDRIVPVLETVPADAGEVTERALIGSVLGATLGAGIGAAVAINPPLGALIGVQAGAVAGDVIGVSTARQVPTYAAIAIPAEPIIPGFYDTWPPGYRGPPITALVPPPAAENVTPPMTGLLPEAPGSQTPVAPAAAPAPG